jgi:hypothetical protein
MRDQWLNSHRFVRGELHPTDPRKDNDQTPPDNRFAHVFN